MSLAAVDGVRDAEGSGELWTDFKISGRTWISSIQVHIWQSAKITPGLLLRKDTSIFFHMRSGAVLLA